LSKLTRAADGRSAGSRGRAISSSPRDTPQDRNSSVFRTLRTSSPTISQDDRTSPAEAEAEDRSVGEDNQNMTVDLGRLAWLGTVGACLIAVLILVLEGYFGYAAVTFAVAVAAAINLL
jgi:hypothetical protein